MRPFLSLLLLLVLPVTVSALTPEQAVTAALTDCDQQAKEDQPFLRYLFLPGDDVDLLNFIPAQRLHVNLISREGKLNYPRKVVPGLWRVDIRDYGWQVQTFEKLADIDPYFHRKQEVVVEVVVEVEVLVDQEYGYYDALGKWVTTHFKKEPRKKKQVKKEKRVKNLLYTPLGAGQLAALSLLTQSQQPIVRADWFLVQGARQLSLRNKLTGVGYYDWLQLKSRDDYFRLIGLDAKAAAINEVRAVVSESGVAENNRQILYDGAATGGHWTTLDTNDQAGRGIAIANLRRGEFVHQAEEHYAHLPNGLPVTIASDANGGLQASVPDNIASNKASLNVSNDTRVHPNISCIQCHRGAVIQPFEDEVRRTYTGRLNLLSNDKFLALELERAYTPNLQRIAVRDVEVYQDAFVTAAGNGLNTTEAVDTYSKAFTKYAYDGLTLQQAAKELGVPEGALRKALQDAALRLGRSDFRLDPFLLNPPRKVPRLTWEDAFQDAQDILYGILKE